MSLRDFILMAMLVNLLGAMVFEEAKRPRRRYWSRRCYAAQKMVAGALEMYNLDKNTKLTIIDPTIMRMLDAGGYLDGTPLGESKTDFTECSEGPGAFRYVQTGNGISCNLHGKIE